MADQDASPSPSMHTARDADTPLGSEDVLGRVVEVPPSNPQSNRVLDFSLQGSTDHGEESVSTSTSRSPLYLVSRPPTRAVLDMEAVDADDKEEGDGDSVVDAVETNLLTEAAVEASNERLKVLVKLEDDTDEVVLDNESNQMRFDLEILDPDTKIPLPPSDWVAKTYADDEKVPKFEDIDNPGNWNEYTFAPKFVKKGATKAYSCHSLPTGCQVVPKQEDGKRVVNGWEFFYDDWEGGDSCQHRTGATKQVPFPNNRKGNLDYELLKNLGLTKTRLLNNDCLFFYQLLLPICDTSKSGVEKDPRMSFYSKVSSWTNTYASRLGLMDRNYGHNFEPVSLEDVLYFDMAVLRDGVHGGSDGAIYRRWNRGSKNFDADIANALTHTRWLQIKRTLKYCDNSEAKRKGNAGYEPAYKYDYLLKCLVHNVNALTEWADLDLCGDETTWAHLGFGEKGVGLLTRVFGKPGVTKGGQTTMLVDVHRLRPRAYIHRHKAHPPSGFKKNYAGMAEVKMLLQQICPMVVSEDASLANGVRQIFKQKPHSTWDNHFSGCEIMDWMGSNGFGGLMTCRRDRLPDGVENKYFHKQGTTNDNKAARVARFNKPVTAVKRESTFTRVHVSFQSTSSTNFTSVNCLRQNSLFVVRKERGVGNNRRKWGIEMNDARQLYLSSYGVVDTMDAQIRRCNMYYRSWKYWHSPRLHFLAMAIVVAYDMYKECMVDAGEYFGLTKAQSNKLLLSFHDFRERLSTQGLKYLPKKKHYPGDRNMRPNTKTGPKRRAACLVSLASKKKRTTNVVTPELFKQAKKADNTRLCGNVAALIPHLDSLTRVKSGNLCAWCGETCYSRCGLCGVGCHHDEKKGKHTGKQCFIRLHDDRSYGLGWKDKYDMFGGDRTEVRERWKQPTVDQLDAHAKHIKAITNKQTRYSLRSGKGMFPVDDDEDE